jgi:hypothetical protein
MPYVPLAMQTTFIETSVFTKAADRLLAQAGREDVTEALTENLRAGSVIPGSGGLRKLRMPGSGRGMRGGYRVIYSIQEDGACTFLLLLFAKNDLEDLTPAEYRELAALIG